MPHVYGVTPVYFAARRLQQRESAAILRCAPAAPARAEEQLLAHKHVRLLTVQLCRQNKGRVQQRRDSLLRLLWLLQQMSLD